MYVPPVLRSCLVVLIRGWPQQKMQHCTADAHPIYMHMHVSHMHMNMYRSYMCIISIYIYAYMCAYYSTYIYIYKYHMTSFILVLVCRLLGSTCWPRGAVQDVYHRRTSNIYIYMYDVCCTIYKNIYLYIYISEHVSKPQVYETCRLYLIVIVFWRPPACTAHAILAAGLAGAPPGTSNQQMALYHKHTRIHVCTSPSQGLYNNNNKQLMHTCIDVD